MKKMMCALLSILLVLSFGLFALASSAEDDDQGKGKADGSNLGDYKVEIVSCRLAKTYDDKAAVIVKYSFTNNSDDAASFTVTFDDKVYQNGIGLNPAYVLADSANYSSDNQSKDIKTGATLEVEVAYELNDEATDIEVEVGELFSWDDTVVKKTFSLAG